MWLSLDVILRSRLLLTAPPLCTAFQGEDLTVQPPPVGLRLPHPSLEVEMPLSPTTNGQEAAQ